jgi:biopolymer transport protein ExbD
MKRMSRNRVQVAALNLTSLMDVFTTLVFFLVINQGSSEVLETPKQIRLPESAMDERPRETVVIFISPEEVTVQGERVALVADIHATGRQNVEPIARRLAELSDSVIGIKTLRVSESEEVTILADRSVPFSVVKKVMSTCTSQGYGRISLAVIQKAPEAPNQQV